MNSKDNNKKEEKDKKGIKFDKKHSDNKDSFKRIGSLVIAVLLVALMAFPSLSSLFVPANQSVIASYKGQEISSVPYGLYDQSVQEQSAIRSILGYSIEDPLSSVILKLASIELADDVNVKINDQKINEVVADNILFKSEIEEGDYVFDQEKYRNTPNNVKLLLRKTAQQNLLYQRVSNDIRSLSELSDFELQYFGKMMDKKKSFDFVSFDQELYPKELIQEYLDTNKEEFKRTKLRSITMSSQEELNEILLKLENGESFSSLALTYSQDIFKEQNEGGDRGIVYKFELNSDFEDSDIQTIFSLEPQAVSPIVKNVNDSYVIFKNEGTFEYPNLDNDDDLRVVKDRLIFRDKGLVEDYLENLARDFAQKARDSSLSLVDSAAQDGLDIKSSDTFPINFGNISFLGSVNSNDEDISSTYDSREFFDIAFRLKENEISEPVVLDSKVLVLSLKEELVGISEDELNTKKLDIHSYITQSIQSQMTELYVDQSRVKYYFDQGI